MSDSKHDCDIGKMMIMKSIQGSRDGELTLSMPHVTIVAIGRKSALTGTFACHQV